MRLTDGRGTGAGRAGRADAGVELGPAWVAGADAAVDGVCESSFFERGSGGPVGRGDADVDHGRGGDGDEGGRKEEDEEGCERGGGGGGRGERDGGEKGPDGVWGGEEGECHTCGQAAAATLMSDEGLGLGG